MLGQLKHHGLIVASYIADVVTDPETTDKALGFRLDALIKLMSQLRQYKEGYHYEKKEDVDEH